MRDEALLGAADALPSGCVSSGRLCCFGIRNITALPLLTGQNIKSRARLCTRDQPMRAAAGLRCFISTCENQAVRDDDTESAALPFSASSDEHSTAIQCILFIMERRSLSIRSAPLLNIQTLRTLFKRQLVLSAGSSVFKD